jgi:protein-tyrosine phosphatase
MSADAPVRGWVDTHLHLLPGVDDGPATPEDAEGLLEAVIAAGTTHAVATPHANYQFHFERDAAQESLQRLQQRAGDRLRLYLGCELHLSYENVQEASATPRRFSLNGGRYLLVEFPEFFERNALEAALQRLRDAGAVPVLAHPERNPVFQQHPEMLDEYLRLGCVAQLTASSFTGRFGKRAQQFSATLLQGERAHIVASDGHSAQQRAPHFHKAAAVIEELAGEEKVQALCRDNPLAMIEDRPLPYCPELASKKRGFLARLRG